MAGTDMSRWRKLVGLPPKTAAKTNGEVVVAPIGGNKTTLYGEQEILVFGSAKG